MRRTALFEFIVAFLFISFHVSAKKPNEKNSFSLSFSAGVPSCFKHTCYPNHPRYLGTLDARGYKIHIDSPTVPPKTSCPAAVEQEGGCPSPAASETLFNTTIQPPIVHYNDDPSRLGKIYMNANLTQLLYVEANGLLAYTTPQTGTRAPPGSYTNLFNLAPATVGSCLDCGTQLQWNYTYLYTCLNPTKGAKGNLTYAQTPGASLQGCTSFFALGGSFCTTRISNDTICGPNAYEYN